MSDRAISAMSLEELAGERDRLRVAVTVAEEQIAGQFLPPESLRLERDRLNRRLDAVQDRLWDLRQGQS